MAKYLLRQALGWAVRVILAINLAYFVATAFLNPASNYAFNRPPLSPEQIQTALRPLNLSTSVPLMTRWWNWLTSIILHWDWGKSPVGGSVNQQIAYRVGVSAQLMLGATILAFIIGVALGVYAAARQYKVSDRVIQFVSIIGLNTSIVVVALAVVYLAIAVNRLAGRTLLFVSGASGVGITGFWNGFVDKVQHLLLPSICLVFISFAIYSLTQRSLLLDNISADYVRLARAKGLTKPTAIRRHALRTSMIPVMVQFAYSLPAIFTGAAITETIFAWNGMGKYLVDTLSKNDIHGAVAVAAFWSLTTGIGAMLSDVFVVILDPRVRVS